jgi:hypothetical protein
VLYVIGSEGRHDVALLSPFQCVPALGAMEVLVPREAALLQQAERVKIRGWNFRAPA